MRFDFYPDLVELRGLELVEDNAVGEVEIREVAGAVEIEAFGFIVVGNMEFIEENSPASFCPAAEFVAVIMGIDGFWRVVGCHDNYF